MLSHQPTTDNQSLGTDATTTNTNTNPTPRGEVNHDLEVIANMDTRFGVRVPIGARVWAGELEGILIGATDELAIIRDDQGQQFAERWGVVTVQASGPVEISSSTLDQCLADQPEQCEGTPLAKASQIFVLREQLRSIEDRINYASVSLQAATFSLIDSDADQIDAAARQLSEAVRAGQRIIHLLYGLEADVRKQDGDARQFDNKPDSEIAQSIELDDVPESAIRLLDFFRLTNEQLEQVQGDPYRAATLCVNHLGLFIESIEDADEANKPNRMRIADHLADIDGRLRVMSDRRASQDNADANWSGRLARTPHATGLLQLNADQTEQLASDPYRLAGLRILDLIAFIESMKEDVESIEGDRVRAIDQLTDLEALIGQIGDNRARRIIERPRFYSADAQSKHDEAIEAAFQNGKAEVERDAAEAAARESEVIE